MRDQYFAVRLCCAPGKFRLSAWLLLLALVGSVRCSAQSLGFAAASSRLANTVSVRELQVSPKAKDDFARGLQRLAKQDPQGSLKHFAAAIAASPDYYEAYYHQGVAQAQLSRNEEALRSFQAAIDLSDGHYPRAEFGYGLILTRIGNAAEAELVVRHGLQTDANIPDGHVVLGLILLKLHRIDEAERSAQEALLLSQPSSAKGHLILADVEGARGKFARQADELEAYLKSNPHDRNQKYLETARDVARKLATRKGKAE
jgi:tetratricopeptide (TPR) repeat protein